MPPIEGHHAKVHLLAPAVSAAAPKFVSACIRGGNLWLSVRSLAANGAFIHHQTKGYGSNAGIEVLDYDLAHRTFSTRTEGVTHYHIMTPVMFLESSGVRHSLRLVTWRVNAVTGALAGLHDSGTITGPAMAAKPRLRTAHIASNQFELIYNSLSQYEVHHPVWMNDAGVPESGAGLASLNNSRGNDTFHIERADSAVSGLTSSGYAIALHDASGAFKLGVWDRRPDLKVPDYYKPYFLTDDSVDLLPHLPGVAVTGVQDQAEENDLLGRALTTGDFNGDRKADLIIGVPFEDIGAVVNAGAVHMLYGSAAGFGARSFVSRDGFDGGQDIQSTPATSDRFGFSLAGGDFNDDGADDLAIGIPGDSVLQDDSGAVHILNGTILGLTWINERLIRQADIEPTVGTLPSVATPGEATGTALAAGDCNGDGFMDLVISAPGEDIGDAGDAGAIFVVGGTANGLIPGDGKFVPEDSGNLPGKAEASDNFAEAIACGDFNADGEADIVAGIPQQDDGDNLSCGAIEIIPGSGDNYVTSAGAIAWFVRRREQVRGILTDLAREEAGGPGAGKMFSHNENLARVHMASSTKTMTLLLVVEALENGDVSLSDDVEVSDLAGTTGGSKLDARDSYGNSLVENGEVIPFIQPGDTMPLRLLIAGMMGESCNRCSVAIGEHVAEKVRGDYREFINMMNDRAAELGMTTSTMGHPAGGWVTHIQDPVTLQREGVKHPLFVKFASFERYGDDPEEVLCGTDAEGDEKCSGPFNQIASMGDYPGRYTWKGGNGGLWWYDDQANNIPDRPAGSFCTASRVTTARRLDRTLAACLQQTGDGAGDSQDLVEYGYRKLFTPDARASREFPEAGGIVGPEGPIRVRNLAIAAWEGHGVTAIIDDNEELRLNVWALNYATQQITAAGAASKTYPLVAGSSYEEPALVDLTDVPTADATADFFTANLIGERLELKAWRVGEEQ